MIVRLLFMIRLRLHTESDGEISDDLIWTVMLSSNFISCCFIPMIINSSLIIQFEHVISHPLTDFYNAELYLINAVRSATQ